MAGLVHDVSDHPRQWQRRRARLGRCRAWQRRDHMAAGLGLPPRIDDRAAATANRLVTPHPGLRIDRLPHRSEDSQRREIVFLWQVSAGFDERSDRRWRGIEHIYFV